MSTTLDTAPESHNPVKSQRFKMLSIFGIALTVYLVGAYTGVLQDKAIRWWSDFFWTFASLAAGWRCLHTAKTRTLTHERRAWNLFGLAALSWFVGMLIWDYYEIIAGELVPFPSSADWFFLGYPVLFTAGLLYYRTQIPTRQYNMIQIANLGLIVCTIVVLCFIILSKALQRSDQTLVYESYALSHAILNFACFVFGLYSYWFYVWRENRRSFRLMLLALFIFAFTDTLYGFQLLGQSFNATSYLNVSWLVAFVLQYWAAFEQDTISLMPSRKIDERGTSRAQIYEAIMPALCIFIVLACTLFYRDRLNEITFNVMVTATIAFAFFLTLREWHSNSLEHRLMKELQAVNVQLEQRVEQRTTELSDAIEELEAFSYSVSHDLRAPLRGINGFSQMLQEDYSDTLDEAANDYLDRIRQGTQKMSHLIEALLELSRVNRHNILQEPVSLDKIANSVIEHLRDLEPDRKVNVTIANNLSTDGDEYLLRIVLENLLGNAWKYTSNTNNARIEFGVEEKDNARIYYVKDNGAGFDMQYYKKLFEPFQRLHGEEYKGTGIGLATVKRCIHRHNGRIWAESKPGAGATFFFTLPSSTAQKLLTAPDRHAEHTVH
ncbi:MAG: ATP-binding protein [Gammaproteobacteria bacterium]|jgi:signal transduction histidine kinase